MGGWRREQPENRDSCSPPQRERSWFGVFVELHVTAEWKRVTEGTSPDNQQFDMHSTVSSDIFWRSQRRSVLGAEVAWRQCPAVLFWFFFSKKKKKSHPIQGNLFSSSCLMLFLFFSRTSPSRRRWAGNRGMDLVTNALLAIEWCLSNPN